MSPRAATVDFEGQAPVTMNLEGRQLGIYAGATWTARQIQFVRFIGDATITDGSVELVSTQAAWGAGDVGALVIPYDVIPAAGFRDHGKLRRTNELASGTRILSVDGVTATLVTPAAGPLTDGIVAVFAVDLTGCTFLAQIRRTEKVPTVLVTIPVTPVAIASGTLTLGPIPPDDTSAVVKDFHGETGVWDLRVTYPDGTVRVWLQGKVVGADSVSRLA